MPQKPSNADWTRLINSAYQNLKGKSQQQSRKAYLDKVSEWPYFGSTTFFCTQRTAPQSVSLVVNSDGIHLFDRGAKTPIKSYAFQSISNWTGTDSSFTIIVGSLAKPVRIVLDTSEGSFIADLFQAYVDALVAAKAVKTTQAYRPF